MEQLIRNVTSSVTNQLSDDKPFYTPDDLREYDIPEFLIQRVEVEIYRNLNESVVPPHSEWADMAATDVEHAWEQFIDAIVAEVRMPASFATTVFETAIADVIEMILEPRRAIPEILFGPKKTLTTEDIEKRLSFISVNSHLAQAINKYMKRKGLSEIEIGTARRVVMKVDERITANYNSLNWAQLLQPLFILAGPRIDTELFRIFFKDRNMDRISRRFDLLSGSLNKTEFIEVLSSPDLLNEEGYEEDQVSLFDVQPSEGDDEAEAINDTRQRDVDESKKRSDSTEGQTSETALDFKNTEEPGEPDKTDQPKGDAERAQSVDVAEEVDDDGSILGSFQTRHRLADTIGDAPEIVSADDLDEDEPEDHEDTNRPESENDDIPLYIRFDDDEEPAMDQAEDEKPGERIADQFFNDEESDEDAEKSASLDIISGLDGGEESEEIEIEFEDKSKAGEPDADDSSGNDEESPIWQSFLGEEDNIEEEDIPEYSGFADLDDEDGDEEAPLIDLTVQENNVESADLLLGWLKDDEDRFTSHIFSGSEKAYEEALIDLNQLDNWKQASRFIEKEIFARNLVDMYDEEAVDFTDRLQAYFDEYKS